MKGKSKSKAIKIIVFIAIILLLSFLVYYFYFKPIPAWETLTDDQKIIEFDNAVNGSGSVYIRPGTNEFAFMLEEIKGIYASNGMYFDENLFLQWYEAHNGATSDIYKPDAMVVSVFNKPGSTKII